MSDNVNWGAFQWDGPNELWDEVLKQLTFTQEMECDVALSSDLTNEQRHYHAGKAASLAEFRSHLSFLREQANLNKK
tara:strand:- start:742 stop:972 length:231 start_codon:yes stop_codon:yes gene_type:complete